MKPKKLIARSTSIVAASLLVCSWTQVASATGPVAVAPGRGGEVVMGQQSSPVRFSVEVGAGYLTGESKELVYWPTQGNHKASELTWAIDNLFMVGVGASLKVHDWMAVNFNGWIKATDGEGTMDDYDWMVRGGDWTDWSHHENTDVTEGSIMDFNVEFSFVRTDVVALKAITGYKRDNFGWEAYGGEYIYTEGGFRNTTGAISDSIATIGYEQTFTSLYFGLGMAAKFNNFELNSRFIYSPLVQGEATDYHYLRNLVTYDEGDDGDMIAFDVSGSFLINPQFTIEVGYSYQRYDMMQGDSEWHFRDDGVVYYFADGAGMDQTSSLLSVSLRYTF
ncbi:MAG: omptin family outer membrane protease [Proteobacteria bacterium]|nr:omptin family outer membrane protease [Pseudomonadota bacterium]